MSNCPVFDSSIHGQDSVEFQLEGLIVSQRKREEKENRKIQWYNYTTVFASENNHIFARLIIGGPEVYIEMPWLEKRSPAN